MNQFPYYKEPILSPHIISALDRFFHFPSQLQVKLLPNSFPMIFRDPITKTESNEKPFRPLKILLTTFWKYPHQGGLSNYIKTYKTEFERLGHTVDIISPNMFDSEDFNKKRKIAKKAMKDFLIRRYGTENQLILQNCVNMHVYEWFLRKYDLTQYDLLCAQDIFTANILSNLNQFSKTPLFLTPHGLYTKSRLKFKNIKANSVEEAYFKEIERNAYQSANKIITISDSFHTPLMEYGARKEQLTTVYSGIDFQIIEKQSSTESESSKMIITCISRLSPRKGHKFLFEALEMIKRGIGNVEVWIVGDGEMRSELERLKDELELDFVKFLGMRTDIPNILSQSDIFVLPTINDNFPISIVEAMFAEQAIITTNCGGIPEMIQHGKTGLLTEPGNAEEIAISLLLLLNNEEIRRNFAQQAKKFANEHFTSKQMVEKIISIYSNYLPGGNKE